MDTAFILRFQETCLKDDAVGVSAGTTTHTKTNGEQTDTDKSGVRRYTALQTGTQTSTRVRNENGDTDPSRQHSLLPKDEVELGTKTMTEVKTESPDNDRGVKQHQILER